MLPTFFVSDKSFIHAEPLRKRSDLICALNSFAKEVGVPETIIADGAPEENSAEVKKFCSQVGTSIITLEKGTPWSSLADKHVSLFKEEVCKDLQASDSHMALWAYCAERIAHKNNVTDRQLNQLRGRTHVPCHMAKKVIYQIFVNLVGMDGSTIGPMTLIQYFRTRLEHWEEHYDQTEALEMKCVNGCLSLMAR